jgi:hypothetical protein
MSTKRQKEIMHSSSACALEGLIFVEYLQIDLHYGSLISTNLKIYGKSFKRLIIM